MNHGTPVAATVVETYEQLTVPGAICYHDDRTALFACCPCGCGDIVHVAFKTGARPTGWIWDGDVPFPTLAPSVRRLSGCKWHGHLVSGTWQPCGDSGR